MLIRICLLLALILSSTAQARHNGSGVGYAFEGCPRDAMQYRESFREYRGCDGERHRRGGGYRGFRQGGRHCGGHSHWNIPVQEARRLNPIEVSPQSLARGETLYRENCLRCHGDYGFGNGPQAKDLRVPPANLHRAARHYSDGELSYIIRKGRDPMPAWEDKLSEDELWNLINYLRFQIGAHHHGPRFGYYTDRYQTGGTVTDKQTDQPVETVDEQHDHPAMDHDVMHEENCNLHQDNSHDEHHDE